MASRVAGGVMFALVASWALAVAIVVMIAGRLWRPGSRAPLPLLAAVAVTTWTLWDGAIVYADLIAQHAWTAATVVIPYVPAKAAVLALLAYFAVRHLLALRKDTSTRAHIAVAAALAALTAVLLTSDVISSIEGARVRAARDPHMPAAQVAAETERVNGGRASQSEILAFLENPLCPPALLEHYAGETQLFKTQVARNPRVPESIVRRLSQDSDPIVRYYASYSRNLPAEELPRLAADSDAMVRESMTWKNELPDADFVRLTGDSAPRVRAAAALQPRISDEDLLRLTMDSDTGVRANATRMAVQRGLQQQ